MNRKQTKGMYICTEEKDCNMRCTILIERTNGGTIRTYEWFPCMNTTSMQYKDTPIFRRFILCIDADGEPFLGAFKSEQEQEVKRQ